MDQFRKEVDKAVEENIKKAQAKQKKGYDKLHTGGQVVSVGQEVFLLNQRRRDRKGGKHEGNKSGPYTVVDITDRKNVTLKNENGLILKTKYPVKDLVPLDIPQPHNVKRSQRPQQGMEHNLWGVRCDESVNNNRSFKL